MSYIERTALVPFSCQQMFDLVNDIDRYPEFMTGCVGAQVYARGDDWLEAKLDLSTAGLKHSFSTRNILTVPTKMEMQLVDGPFSSFTGAWEFESLSESACKVSFKLDFEFANKFVSMAAGKVFEKIASEQVAALCKRAKNIYGDS